MGTTVRLVSLNVNGLNTPKKRDRVMTKVKKDRAQIIYLQETHLNKVEHDKLKRYGKLHRVGTAALHRVEHHIQLNDSKAGNQ